MKSVAKAQLVPAPQLNGRFLDVADAIGCRLVRDAIWQGDRCSWLAWAKEPVAGTFHSAYRAAPAGLYLGVAGIALFLVRLAHLTGDPLQRAAAAGAFAQVQVQLDRADPLAYGLYAGSSGAAWSLLQAAAVDGNAQWREGGLAALRHAAASAGADAHLDLLAGQAGLATVLASVAAAEGDTALADGAVAGADRLVASAEHQDGSVSWPGHAPQSANLLGLSHGTTGMALALLEVNQLRPRPAYVETAVSALRYEQSHFDPARGNWPDFRLMPGVEPAAPPYPVAWCHGAPGMGFARLRMRDLLPGDADLPVQADAALATTRAALERAPDPAADLTLCHGITGQNDFVLQAAHQLGRAGDMQAALAVGDMLLQKWHKQNLPWGCGIPDCGETPSLLTGTAGIGYHFLRLYDPRIPTVLLPPSTILPRPAPAA